MEEPTPKIMLEFLATLPIGHQLTMVAKRPTPFNGEATNTRSTSAPPLAVPSTPTT